MDANLRLDGVRSAPRTKRTTAETLLKEYYQERASRQLNAQDSRNLTTLCPRYRTIQYDTPYNARMTALWRLYAGERDTQ